MPTAAAVRMETKAKAPPSQNLIKSNAAAHFMTFSAKG
jgi:hypothetical protein